MKVVFLNPQQEMGGIQCLSAFLKRAGHQTALVNDPNLFQNPWVNFSSLSKIFEDEDFIIRQIEQEKPDLLALSVVTDEMRWAIKWASRVKARIAVPIVVGNAHPTFHPEQVLRQNCFDYVVRGEGEITLLELLEVLEGKRQPADVLGLGFKDSSGEIRINNMRPLIEDLDTLPFPDKDLYYEKMPYLNRGYTTMTGRGCPYRCTFCDNNSSQRLYRQGVEKVQKWTRRHSPEYVVQEILWAKERYNIQHVRFNDEDFSYDKRWIRAFAPLYKERVGIPFFAWTYPNTIDEEIASLLAEAGCDSVEMGIQSGAEQLRREVLNRHTKDQQIVSAFNALRRVGIRATADIIIGLPTETKGDLDATVRLLIDANPWHLYAFWLRYYPSTQILSIAKERKLLSPQEINLLETNLHSRGHLAGGTELEKNGLSRRYHSFIVLLPLMPGFLSRFFLKHDLIRKFPVPLSPFLLVNITKMIKRNRYDEFRARGWAMIRIEVVGILKRSLRKQLLGVIHRLPLCGSHRTPCQDVSSVDRYFYNLSQIAESLSPNARVKTWFGGLKGRARIRIVTKLRNKPQGNLLTIDRVRDITPSEFRKKYMRPGLPVVFEGAAKSWGCYERWSFDFFQRNHGSDHALMVEAEGLTGHRVSGRFDLLDLKALIQNIRDGGTKYLRFSPLVNGYSSLQNDLDLKWVNAFRNRWNPAGGFQFFIGGQGTRTRLHCDMQSNFFVAVCGEKRWRLYSPKYSAVLNPPATRGLYSYSSVDVYNPDLQSFPGFDKIDYYDVVLKPGDILFNPPFMWHDVTNLTDQISVSCKFGHLLGALRASSTLTFLRLTSTNPPLWKSFWYTMKDINLIFASTNGNFQKVHDQLNRHLEKR